MQKILIFTDLDGSLLHRDTFKFDEIKDYIKQLLSKGIFIIPNTSKTEKEILDFNNELGSSLPYFCENGGAINGLVLLNSNTSDILKETASAVFNVKNNPLCNICLVAVFELAAANFCIPTNECLLGVLPSLASFNPVTSRIICK